MLNRIAHRLKYTMGSALLGGLILLFFKEYRMLGVYTIIVAIVFYIFFNWLAEKTNSKQSYEADDKGNAKPNYR